MFRKQDRLLKAIHFLKNASTSMLANATYTHTIHVWYIYLHLVDFVW